MVTRPPHPFRRRSTRPNVPVLPIVQRCLCEVGVLPWRPPVGTYEAVQEAFHDDGPRVLLPGPAKVCPDGGDDGEEVGGGDDAAALDGDAGVLERVSPALGGDDVGLADEWSAGGDHAALEHDGCVAEYEVDSAVDVAVFVELALGVNEQGILVALKPA